MLNKMLIEIIRILLILLFVYAATSKLIDQQKFAVELGKSPLINTNAEVVSIAIPIVEIVASILLSIGSLLRIGLYLSLLLMTSFTAYIIAILQFSYYIPCTCGGVLQSMGWTEHLIFNIFFILASAAAIILSKRSEILSKRSEIQSSYLSLESPLIEKISNQ